MKGPFRSPLDEETALLFWRKMIFKKTGIALLEVLIALALLAITLLIAAYVRLTLLRSDKTQLDELSMSALMRQACMAFQAGDLINGTGTMTNTNVFPNVIGTNLLASSNILEGRVESGDYYRLQGLLQKDDTLGFQRMSFDASITDLQSSTATNANEIVYAFGSRVQALPLSWVNVNTNEPTLSLAGHTFELRVYTETPQKGKVYIAHSLSGTNLITNYAPGTLVTIQAEPLTGYTFTKWSGRSITSIENNTNNVSAVNPTYPTNAYILMDDDKEVKAEFAP
ncbi:MAG: InlB B-repeat-containing protein [Verrucomicrobiota bacterium]